MAERHAPGVTPTAFHPIAGNRQCAVCAAPLSVHEAVRGVTCDRPACRYTQLRRDVDRQAKARAAVDAKAWQWLTELAPQCADESTTVVAVVPSNDRRLVPLSAERRSLFEQRLSDLVDAAFEQLTDADPPDPAPALREPEAVTATLLQACATCRGQCCWQGGDHAFLQPETIGRVLSDRAPGDREAVVGAYLDCLGDRVVEDSCVYHGPGGCRLERDMRSDLCNAFRCHGLNALAHGLDGRPGTAAFVVAEADGELRRARVVAGDGAPMGPEVFVDRCVGRD